MTIRPIIAIVFACLYIVSCTEPQFDLAITNVSVFDSKNGKVIPNQTVLIVGDTIAKILNNTDGEPAKIEIDGTDKLLTPGFIDTHVHTVGNYGADAKMPSEYDEEGLEFLRQQTAYHYLNQGVTTIIDMGMPEAWMDITLNWQNTKLAEYPNIYISGGAMVSDDDRHQPAHHIEVKNPEDAREKVRDYAKRGLKYMKLYSKLRKDDYEAMANEAQKEGILINSHVDNNIMSIEEAMRYGVTNFEHFFTLIPSVLNYDEHWPKMNAMYDIQMSPSIDEFAAQMVYFFGYIKANPELEEKLLQLFDIMAKNGANLSSALNVVASSANKSDFFTSFEYFPIRNQPMVNYNDTQWQQLSDAYDAMLNYLKIAHDKGVTLRLGTDCRYGGEALLSEITLLVNSKQFSLEEALQMATINGYKSMRLDTDYGTIDIGKTADLVLFENNPFEDINHIKGPKTVIKDGKIITAKRFIGEDFRQVVLEEGVNKAEFWIEEHLNGMSVNKIELSYVVRELFEGDKFEEAIFGYEILKSKFENAGLNFETVQITNTCYRLINEGKLEALKTYYNFCNTNFPELQQYMGLAVYMSFINSDIATGKNFFNENKDSDQFIVDENELNGLGYLFMAYNEYDKAITVFQMNTQAFPNSANVYDSLGEAYLKVGDTTKAKLNYTKAIELNPNLESAIQALKRI